MFVVMKPEFEMIVRISISRTSSIALTLFENFSFDLSKEVKRDRERDRGREWPMWRWDPIRKTTQTAQIDTFNVSFFLFVTDQCLSTYHHSARQGDTTATISVRNDITISNT